MGNGAPLLGQGKKDWILFHLRDLFVYLNRPKEISPKKTSPWASTADNYSCFLSSAALFLLGIKGKTKEKEERKETLFFHLYSLPVSFSSFCSLISLLLWYVQNLTDSHSLHSEGRGSALLCHLPTFPYSLLSFCYSTAVPWHLSSLKSIRCLIWAKRESRD